MVEEGTLQRRVGANVRQIRERVGLSQEALAEELGVHRTYVGGIERGERNLSLKSIEWLANGLEVDPAQLLRKVSQRRRQS